MDDLNITFDPDILPHKDTDYSPIEITSAAQHYLTYDK